MNQAKAPILMNPTKLGPMKRMAVMGHVLMITTLCKSMETSLLKHILNQNHLITHMEIPATKESMREKLNQISDHEADQEYSWKEEADTEISLEEEREQEEDFSETGEVYGGEVCSQSGEAENKKSLMLKRDHGVITLIWKMMNKMKLNIKSG
ncbi:hypothetical protein YC2023_099023 [Brassica napus]